MEEILNDILPMFADLMGSACTSWRGSWDSAWSGPARRARYARCGWTIRFAAAHRFESWATLPGLRRIIVSHGDVIDGAQALFRAAAGYRW